MEIEPLEEFKKYSRHFANCKKYIKKMFDENSRSFGKFILIITAIALLLIILIYISENIFNKLQGEKITFEVAIVSAVTLGVFLGILAYFYFKEQVREPKNRRLKAKFGAVFFCIIIFFIGTYGGILVSEFLLTEYKDIKQPEEKYQFFVDILLVLLTFTALVWYLLHRVLEVDIKSGIEKTKRQNRSFTEAQTFKNTGYAHFLLYKNSKQDTDNKTKKRGGDANKIQIPLADEAVDNLRSAISYTSLSFNSAKKLDEEGNEMLFCTIRNNLAYYKTEKWNCLRERKGIDYFKQKNKRDKYNLDRIEVLNHLKYLKKNEEENYNIPPEFLNEFLKTSKYVEKIFNDMDILIGN